MSTFTQTLIEGNEGAFKSRSLTPMQKLTLQYVIFGLVYYGFAAIEGMLMRLYEVKPFELVQPIQFFAIMTAHPLVGIFGSSYLLVFGAFTFVFPMLLKKPLWSFKAAQWTLWLIVVGVFTFWLTGFITHYSPMYTLYWPLPADVTQFSALGGAVFIVGVALVMVGTLLFVLNIFKTLTYTPAGWEKQPAARLLGDGLGLTTLKRFFTGNFKKQTDHLVPLPAAAITRGTVDVLLNALVLTFSGVLILVYMIGELTGNSLQRTWVDALLYKNWYWWGLDLIADGLVLIFVAGTWYLIAQLITGREVFMARWARLALGVELVVSWTVWSHHLLSDQAQPELLKMGSGEMVTAFELITQGLAFFITLATLWQARPLKMTNELKFLIGGLLGFALAVPAGILQADVGLNRILHNTQWVVGPHVHVAILIGLTMTLYSAIYLLLPILTNGAKLWSQKLANVHFWCHLIGGIGMGAFMGMAGLQGMLRRTIYFNFEYGPYMILAAISGALLLIALAAFLVNIVMTLGLKNTVGIFQKSDLPVDQLTPAES